MEIINSPVPVYAMSISLVAALLIAFSGSKPNLREFWTIAAGIGKFLITLSMLPVILEGKSIEYLLVSILPGLDLKFSVNPLGLLFALTASFLWIITSFYSIGYVRSLKEHAQTRYFICFALALSATIGVAFSANMFTTFVFYELITLCTFSLVAHKETPEALKGARRYITYLLGTSVGFQLFAIFLTYNVAGTLDFAPHGILAGKASDLLLSVIFILFVAGITKAAIMPFHSWLPAAMVAPTPVSALLHAVAVVKTGVFVFLKVVLYIFGVDLLSRLSTGTALIYLASTTIIVASIIALRQDNLKARLAYSTISQLSYVILGVALLSASGITGSILHIVVHAFGKITLFFTAGAIYVMTHKTKVSELDGIGRQMPLTMGAFTLGALSMIGVPPFAGFLSKWYLGIGAIEAGHLPVIAVLATSTILNAAYLLPIVYVAFFKEPTDIMPGPDGTYEIKEAPLFMVTPLALTALGTLVIFIFPSAFLDLAKMVVSSVMGGFNG